MGPTNGCWYWKRTETLPLNRQKSELKYSPQALSLPPGGMGDFLSGLYFRTSDQEDDDVEAIQRNLSVSSTNVLGG